MSLAAGTRLGPYEILAPIGAGGMGEVYGARDTRLARDVAVKVLPSSFSADPDRLHRFEQEACAAGALNHPNILIVHDIGKHDGSPYVVSELLEGETLRKRLGGAALAQRRVIDYALQIAHGLAAAHDKGIVHRDLKPDNIFITKELRREVENAAEVELSITPETTADPHVSKTGDRTISVGDKTAASTAESVAHSTSSAEYVVGEVKKHKLGAMIVVALLALVVAGLGYGIYRLTAKRDKPALSFQSAKFTRLTTTGKASGVAISPDGKYVVHIQDDGGQQSLWMRQTATQSNVQIMPPAVNVKYSRLMFSRDGDYLFYVARENNAAPALYQIPALGGSPRKLSPNVGNFMALSLDGARVASIRRAPDEGKDVLVVSNVDGSGERRLVERKIPERMLYAGGRGSAPAWSPEGHRIAFASYEYGIVYANVVVAQVDSGVEETLSSEKWYNMGQLAWLSDGSGVVMLASDQRGYPPQLWHLSYPEGSARRITNDLNSYTTVSVTADSRSLVTVQTETLSTIWVAPERDSNGARQISFGTAKIDEGAVWTPDGRIVYESRTGDSINIWIMDADGGNQKQLTFDNGRTPDVSPDGRYIVFRSNRSITPHIYRMEMDGSNLKQLTDGTGEFGPRMTPDGKWVYFSSRSSGNLTVWRASIDGGKITQIIDHPSYGADFSPDGKWLGCIYWSGQEDAPRTVAIIPFEGGQPVKLFDLGANPTGRWAPDGRALIYVDTRGDVSNLWTQAIDGGTPKQLTEVVLNWTADLKR